MDTYFNVECIDCVDVECGLVLKTRTRNLLGSEYLDLVVALNKDQDPLIEEDSFC